MRASFTYIVRCIIMLVKLSSRGELLSETGFLFEHTRRGRFSHHGT